MVRPRSTVNGLIVTSSAISTVGSIHVDAGSTIVTPASMCRSLMRSRSTAAACASSTRVFTPSVSSEFCGNVSRDTLARLDEQRDHVGEVQLALDVLRLEPLERGHRAASERNA